MNVSDIKKNLNYFPRAACVLGSGLGAFAELIEADAVIDYKDIDGFIQSGVDGHKGRLIIGKLIDVPIAVMQGRVHFYEGYSMSDVVRPIRLLKDLGAETLILTNAAGGISKSLKPSDIMLISDHIMLVPNPLIGKNDDNYGVRFPDMSRIYDKELTERAERIAIDQGLDIKRGVYAQLSGPSYETPAEIRALRALGADAVGMSTAAEAVTARHAGMRVLGLSLITNAAAAADTILSHEEVKQAAFAAEDNFNNFLKEIILSL